MWLLDAEVYTNATRVLGGGLFLETLLLMEHRNLVNKSLMVFPFRKFILSTSKYQSLIRIKDLVF